MSWHGLRWSCMRKIMCNSEDMPRKQDNSLVTSVSSKHWIVSVCFFMLLPDAAYRSKLLQITLYSLLLLFINMFKLSIICCWGKIYVKCGLSLCLYIAWTQDSVTHVTFLKPQGISCLTLWIKLTITWDFNPRHLSPPFSKFPLTLKWWYIKSPYKQEHVDMSWL